MSQQPRTSHLPEPDIARLRRKLEDLRASLLDDERATAHDQLAWEPGGGDYVDLAERTTEDESTLQRATVRTRLRVEVENALDKMDEGTYGLSEVSGEPIDLERLEAIPWARRTAAEEEVYQDLAIQEIVLG